MVTMLHAPTLGSREVHRRARRVLLVLSDVDGVWTDGGVYYSESGESFKRFSIRDGMAVARLREAGVQTGIITGERSPAVARRAEKLGLAHVFLDIADKRSLLPDLLARSSVALDQLAFMGDDCNDLGLIQAIGAGGLTGAPVDAMPEIASAVHFQSAFPGGHGAFRDFAEWILRWRARPEPAERRSAALPAALVDVEVTE